MVVFFVSRRVRVEVVQEGGGGGRGADACL